MVPVMGVRPVLPDVRVRETFALELSHLFVISHSQIVAGAITRESPPETTTPSLQKWGLLQKGRAVFRREDRLRTTRPQAAELPPQTGVAAPAGHDGRDRAQPLVSLCIPRAQQTMRPQARCAGC